MVTSLRAGVTIALRRCPLKRFDSRQSSGQKLIDAAKTRAEGSAFFVSLLEELHLVLGNLVRLGGQRAEGPAERGQHILRMADREEIDCRRVLPLDEPQFQRLHEARGRHPKIVADQGEALHAVPYSGVSDAHSSEMLPRSRSPASSAAASSMNVQDAP